MLSIAHLIRPSNLKPSSLNHRDTTSDIRKSFDVSMPQLHTDIAPWRSQVLFSSKEKSALTWKHVKTIKDRVVGDIEKYSFSNGMELYALKKTEVPLVCYGEFFKRAGAAKENERNNGVSHFLEHLIFKGSPTVKPGEWERFMERKGAGVNAWTWWDGTFYYNYNIPKRVLPEIIKTRAQVVLNPLIPSNELKKERYTVVEEIRRAQSDKESTLSNNLFKQVWPGSPYSRTVLGHPEVVFDISREDILSYYKKNYSPKNMAIFAVGDFDKDSLLKQISIEYNRPFLPNTYNRKTHASLYDKQMASEKKSTRKMLRSGNPLPPSSKEIIPEVMVEDDVEIAIMEQGFAGPDPMQKGGRKEINALELLGVILSEGQSSRLWRSIVEEKALASSIHAGVWAPRRASMLSIGAEAKPEKLSALKMAIRRELDKIAQQGVTSEELAKAKKILRVATANIAESIGGIMDHMGAALALDKIDNAFDQSLKAYEAITEEDIKLVAQKYLTPEATRTRALVPHEYTHKVYAGQRKPKQAHFQGLYKLGDLKFGGGLYDGTKSIQLSHGTELLFKKKPGLKTAISIRIKGGNCADKIPGETDLLCDMIERGTKKMPSEVLQRHLDKNGLDLSVSTQPDSILITLSGLSEDKAEMFGILKELMSQEGLAITSKDLKKIKDRIIDQYKADIGNGSQYLASINFTEALFPESHPYGTVISRVIQNFDKLTPQYLRETFQRLFTRPNMTISIVSSDLTLEEAKNKIEDILRERPVTPIEVPAIPKHTIHTRKVITHTKETEQAEILQGWMAPSVNDIDYPALIMLNTILYGGLSTRLFKTFRTKEKGLCYEVSSDYDGYNEGGCFQFYIGTNPVNIPIVMDLLDKEVDQLTNSLPTDEEMEKAYNTLESNIIAATQLSDAVSHYLTRHRGLNRDSNEELLEKLKKVTPEQIRAVALKYLAQPSITTILAPQADLEAAQLPVNGELSVRQGHWSPLAGRARKQNR